MKKSLYIFLILSFLSIGCCKDDDVQIVQETPSGLDDNLYGVWKDNNENNSTYDYYRSYTSNGVCATWRVIVSSGSTYAEDYGNWWVESNYLFSAMVYTDEPDIFVYAVSGDVLTLDDGSIWRKQ